MSTPKKKSTAKKSVTKKPSVKRAPKTKGLHAYRFKDNPEEKRFAEAWAKENSNERRTSVLAYLLNVGDQNFRPKDPSDRDQVVAATVIQWLGSEVGQGFLRDLGYEKGELEAGLTTREDVENRLGGLERHWAGLVECPECKSELAGGPIHGFHTCAGDK